MKIAVGIVDVGTTKNYVVEKFNEMLDACVRPHGVDIVWSTDKERTDYDVVLPMSSNSSYVEDICMIGRRDIVNYARESGYDKLVWQGIDCLYQSSKDFEKLIHRKFDVIGALTTARSNSNAAVAGLFIRDENGLTDEHTQFSDWVLDHEWIIEADVPGTDALVISKNCLDLDWQGKHIPWYVRRAQGGFDLTCEGWYCQELIKRGQKIYLDTSIKTWHVHEDGIARMWKGIEKPLKELSWD